MVSTTLPAKVVPAAGCGTASGPACDGAADAWALVEASFFVPFSFEQALPAAKAAASVIRARFRMFIASSPVVPLSGLSRRTWVELRPVRTDTLARRGRSARALQGRGLPGYRPPAQAKPTSRREASS